VGNTLRIIMAGAAFLLAGAMAQAAEIPVTSTADSGGGSLRDAIFAANLTTGDDIIVIELAAGSIISVDSDLPAISRPLRIEADNPRIQLQPSLVSSASRGLQANSSTGSVEFVGLDISGFPVGVVVAEGIIGMYSTVVRDNDGDGVQVNNGVSGVIGNEVDGSEGCYIYGNGGVGIRLGAGGKMPNVTVRNNRIGVGPLGEVDGNSGAGLLVTGTEADVEFYILRNLIAANGGAGISVENAEAGFLIVGGNTIGLGADNAPAGNLGGGISITNTSTLLVGAAGGELPGREPNTISSNLTFGVQLTVESTGCSISRNDIVSTDGPGVLLTGGAFENVVVNNTLTSNTGAGIEVAAADCIGNNFTANEFRLNGDLVVLAEDAHGGQFPPGVNALFDRLEVAGAQGGQSFEWYADDGSGEVLPAGTGISQLFLEDLSSFYGQTIRVALTDINDGTSELSEAYEIQPPATVTEDNCPAGVAYDDDDATTSVQLPVEAEVGGFVMLFEPPSAPFHVQQVCLKLQAAGTGPLLGAVAFYQNQGGTPGALITRVPFGLQLTEDLTYYSIDVTDPRISIESSSVFIGLLYNKDAAPNVALAADAGEGVTARPLFRQLTSNGAWDSFGSVPLEFDVIGVRASGEETGCNAGIAFDDGTFEGSFGPTSVIAGFGLAATPPSYPYEFSGMCMRLFASDRRATFNATLNVYGYDQGTLGSLLLSTPLEAVPLTTSPSWFYFALPSGVTITENQAFFEVEWTLTQPGVVNEVMGYDANPATPLQDAFAKAAIDGSFVAMNLVVPGSPSVPAFRSFGWRIDGAPAGEGEGTVDGEGSIDGEGSVDGEGNIDGEGDPTEGEGEGEGAVGVPHSADPDGNFIIDLSEVLRVVQLYNADGFGCDAGEEDGFSTNPADRTCAPHNADYDTQDWLLSLSEMLRIVQIYNLQGYSNCPANPDGFCAGA
jgi:hypothetical protein